MSPLRGEKPQNWPLSKLNTGRFALRAMLPVISVEKEWSPWWLNSLNEAHGSVESQTQPWDGLEALLVGALWLSCPAR